MGNAELNALHFHTAHPETGRPLREHTDKNLLQHRCFLNVPQPTRLHRQFLQRSRSRRTRAETPIASRDLESKRVCPC